MNGSPVVPGAVFAGRAGELGVVRRCYAHPEERKPNHSPIMTNDANPSFRLRLQLCGCDILTGIAIGAAFSMGFKHPIFWFVALVLIFLSALGTRSLRQRVKTAPPLNHRQRRIVFACYVAPYALFVIFASALLAYIHAKAGPWIVFILPAPIVFAMIVLRYYQIHDDRTVA